MDTAVTQKFAVLVRDRYNASVSEATTALYKKECASRSGLLRGMFVPL